MSEGVDLSAAGEAAAGGAILAANTPSSDESVLLGAKQLGMICDGCSRPIENGFRFSRFLDQFVPELGGKATIVNVAYCCVRDDCEAAGKAKETADVVEPIEYVWLRKFAEPEKGAEGAGDAVEGLDRGDEA